jgi:hypothetical protein
VRSPRNSTTLSTIWGHAENLDHKEIEALRTERHAMVKGVEANYNGNIHVLEAQAKLVAKK